MDLKINFIYLVIFEATPNFLILLLCSRQWRREGGGGGGKGVPRGIEPP